MKEKLDLKKISSAIVYVSMLAFTSATKVLKDYLKILKIEHYISTNPCSNQKHFLTLLTHSYLETKIIHFK